MITEITYDLTETENQNISFMIGNYAYITNINLFCPILLRFEYDSFFCVEDQRPDSKTNRVRRKLKKGELKIKDFREELMDLFAYSEINKYKNVVEFPHELSN